MIAVQNNRMPVTGFLFMLAGPTILVITGLLTGTFGFLSETVAGIVSWTAIILPGIGVVISIVSLARRNKAGKLGRSLAIVTLVMCNPFFYAFYFFICIIAGNTLAGLGWM